MGISSKLSGSTPVLLQNNYTADFPCSQHIFSFLDICFHKHTDKMEFIEFPVIANQ